MKTKMKTSLTLSREVVRGIDRVAGKKRSRSAVVDDGLRGYVSQRERAAANACDVDPREETRTAYPAVRATTLIVSHKYGTMAP